MRQKRTTGKAELLATARVIARELQQENISGLIRIKMPTGAAKTQTDGWRAVIGWLRSKRATLEVWLDRFSGHAQRKLYAGFCFPTVGHVNRLTRRIPRTLTPIRTIVEKDYTEQDGSLVLVKRLARSQFGVPIVEKYPYRRSYFFGVYSSADGSAGIGRDRFCQDTAAFFAAVAELQRRGPVKADSIRDVYPQRENRKRVVSHLQRERCSLLAIQRKIRDDYRCQICGFRFEDLYGALGHGFAEAHHLNALSNFRGQVITDVDDLTTVCANCHRMLHKMSGTRKDFAELRKIVKGHQK